MFNFFRVKGVVFVVLSVFAPMFRSRRKLGSVQDRPSESGGVLRCKSPLSGDDGLIGGAGQKGGGVANAVFKWRHFAPELILMCVQRHAAGVAHPARWQRKAGPQLKLRGHRAEPSGRARPAVPRSSRAEPGDCRIGGSAWSKAGSHMELGPPAASARIFTVAAGYMCGAVFTGSRAGRGCRTARPAPNSRRGRRSSGAGRAA